MNPFPLQSGQTSQSGIDRFFIRQVEGLPRKDLLTKRTRTRRRRNCIGTGNDPSRTTFRSIRREIVRQFGRRLHTSDTFSNCLLTSFNLIRTFSFLLIISKNDVFRGSFPCRRNYQSRNQRHLEFRRSPIRHADFLFGKFGNERNQLAFSKLRRPCHHQYPTTTVNRGW